MFSFIPSSPPLKLEALNPGGFPHPRYDQPLLIVYAGRLKAEDKEEKLEALNRGGF